VLETHLRDNAHSSQSRQSQSHEEDHARKPNSTSSESQPPPSAQGARRGITPPRSQHKPYASGSPGSNHGQSSPGGHNRRPGGGRSGPTGVKSKTGEVILYSINFYLR